jgi:23S rRNA (pseudouridine1915-N3)-methyltransferase
MHVRLLAVGKLRESYTRDAAADFRKRLAPYHRFEEQEVRAELGTDPAAAMAAEAASLLALIDATDHVWLLDRTGAELDSRELAARIEALPHRGIARLTLVVAGTYGADARLLARADFRWSLSKLTLLHEWARVFVLEQVYRAAKIARNEPYHH